jgi:hypothetical protein
LIRTDFYSQRLRFFELLVYGLFQKEQNINCCYCLIITNRREMLLAQPAALSFHTASTKNRDSEPDKGDVRAPVLSVRYVREHRRAEHRP